MFEVCSHLYILGVCRFIAAVKDIMYKEVVLDVVLAFTQLRICQCKF